MGDPAPPSDDSAPAAQQLCVIAARAPAVALGWTQKGDGLLCADDSGGLTMYRVACSAGSQTLSSRQSSEAATAPVPEPLNKHYIHATSAPADDPVRI